MAIARVGSETSKIINTNFSKDSEIHFKTVFKETFLLDCFFQ